MRMLGADDPHVELAGEADVVDEPSAPDEKGRILEAGNRPPEHLAATLRVGFDRRHSALPARARCARNLIVRPDICDLWMLGLCSKISIFPNFGTVGWREWWRDPAAKRT